MELLSHCLLFSIPAAILLLYLLRRPKSRHHCSRLPPGPKQLPIIGNLLELDENIHHTLTRLAKSHGPLMSLKVGMANFIVVSSPEMVREVLQKHDQSFSVRPVLDAARALRYQEDSMLWLPAGRQWRNLRRICSTEIFSSQRIKYDQSLRLNKVRDLIAYVKEQCLAGETVDVGRAAFTTVLNTISTTIFSVDLGDFRVESAQSFGVLVLALAEEAGKPNVSDFFPVLAAVDLQGSRRRTEAIIRKIDDIFDKLIDERMAAKAGAGESTDDFLDSLIEDKNVDQDSRLDRHGIKSLLKDLFLAGIDTISYTIQWAMAELLHNPSIMEKAQAELVQTIGNGKEFEESDIQKLPYLEAILKETFRLHPVVSILVHRAETCVELCGYTIPEGTKVIVNAWAMGRDEDVWRNPEQFTPERFLGKDIDYKGHDFELIPFGAGRRMCPAVSLSVRMIHMVLASLLLQFNWKLPEGMEPRNLDMTDKFGFATSKAIPLVAIPVLR